MARRLGALAVAVLMIAGAVVLRNHIDDDSGSSGGASDGGSETVALTCATELAVVCNALVEADPSVRATVEPAGVTADKLEATSGAIEGMDGWLVEAPWPDIVDGARQSSGTPSAFATTSDVLARSPLVMAMWNDRLAALLPNCANGALTWKCVSEVAGEKWSSIGGESAWQTVKPGFADPIDDGVGALVLAQAASSFLGTTNLSRSDFETDEFQNWITQLAGAVPQNPTFEDMLAIGQSAVDVVGTTEAEAGPALASSRDKDKITITYPAPMATADVVLASVDGASGGERLARIVSGDAGRRALAGAGWRVPDEPAVEGVDTSVSLPSASGLPSPGVIDALRDLWKGAR
ncbi:MAG TPA: hypothetical protein VK461_02435 [Acidimicrobiales bacterium]|nr:hypothetical protein [Acidimicrobiales bacterium]